MALGDWRGLGSADSWVRRRLRGSTCALEVHEYLWPQQQSASNILRGLRGLRSTDNHRRFVPEPPTLDPKP